MVAAFVAGTMATSLAETIRATETAPSIRKRILLIDDDPSLLAYAVFLLTQAGYEVCEARDGCEALHLVEERQIRSDRFDLLVTDIRMPGMSGVSLLRELRMQKIHVPVLVITGFLDAASLKELKQMKYLDILVKPFKPAELIQYIERLTIRDLSC